MARKKRRRQNAGNPAGARDTSQMTKGAKALVAAGILAFFLIPVGVIATKAIGGQVDMNEVLTPGPLADIPLGRDDAPVTVVEYASMTCSHCSGFQSEIFPEIRKRAINTGKARWIFREFPLDAVAVGVAMLPRCVSSGRYNKAVETLLVEQREWMAAADRTAALKAIMAPFGLDSDEFDACLNDEDLKADIGRTTDRGADFGVSATPSFIIDGHVYGGGMPADRMMELIDQAAASAAVSPGS